ncbi:ABC transporter ATP-binding protein [Enterocloster lavalensis]|uniref:ABC transporter ATP-binding protein n=1 Tax=Enterocloster lavalensis TaxID=460384 RepID=UPI0034A513B1
MGEKLLEIKDLVVTFKTDDGVVTAVDGVNLSIDYGETLGIVGESGCGKSVTSFSIMQLLPVPPAKIVRGEILFKGDDLLKKTDLEMSRVRGDKISMIFQEPMTSLDPVYTIGNQLTEAITLHQRVTSDEAKKIACNMLMKVGISMPEERLKAYPHQLSGGMRQRVMIAMAICCNPELLIADEPTTALDVTIQAQILNLMRDLKNERKMSIILVTHDLGVIAAMCSKVAVMYCGQIVEYAGIRDLFYHPVHPYTRGLIRCIPQMDRDVEHLPVIDGHVPNLLKLPAGCRFAPRCPHATELCKKERPNRVDLGSEHWAACHYALSGAAGEEVIL